MGRLKMAIFGKKSSRRRQPTICNYFAEGCESRILLSAAFAIADLGDYLGAATGGGNYASYTYVYGMNDSGQVVGATYTSGKPEGFRTEPGGSIATASDLGAGIPSAINASGQVVGAGGGTGGNHAFRTAANGQITAASDLGLLPGFPASSQAAAINASGQVVGYGYSGVASTTNQRAFRTAANGVITASSDLGTIRGGDSNATGINNAGQIVGTSGSYGAGIADHAFRTTATGSITVASDLGSLGGASGYSYASAINASGQVAGASVSPSDPNMQYHAIRTTATGTINAASDLGTLGGSYGHDSTATSINDAGQVVGNSNGSSGSSHAFFVDVAGGMQDLNNLIPASSGWVLIEAIAINNSGQILGEGSFGGQTHWFLLTPSLIINTLADPSTPTQGTLSLREAILTADTEGGVAPITFASGLTGTINLAGALPDLSGNVTIDGPGANVLTVNGQGFGSVFTVDAGATATIENLTITGGNSTSNGGAIDNLGMLSVTDCTITDNTAARGGGVENAGTLTLTSSTLNENFATQSGGAVDNSGTLAVTNCTITGNIATLGGGGINDTGTSTLVDCTIVGNSAPLGGGILWGASANHSVLDGSIVAANMGGDVAGGAGPQGSNDLVGTGSNGSLSHTVLGSTASPIDPLLQPLAYNGGPTQTMLPLPGSRAIGVGFTFAAANGVDQCGTTRPTDTGAADIGAYQGTAPSLLTLADLAGDVYRETPQGYATSGYSYVQVSQLSPLNGRDPSDAGFAANAYVNTANSQTQIVVAIRGTFLDDLDALYSNLASDYSFASNTPTTHLITEVSDTAAFIANVASHYAGASIILTGHSLGGAVAQLIGHASGLSAVTFNAPGAAQFIGSFGSVLSQVVGLGAGGPNINYRIFDDQISLCGMPFVSPFGETAILQMPSGILLNPWTNPDLDFLRNLGKYLLDSNSLHAITTVLSQVGQIAPQVSSAGEKNDAPALQKLLVGVVSSAAVTGEIVHDFLISASTLGQDDLIDPGGGTDFTFVGQAGSPNLAFIVLPVLAGISSYNLRYLGGDGWSSFQEIQPGVQVSFGSSVDGIDFDPLDSNGQGVAMPDAFLFDVGFASIGTFTGALTQATFQPTASASISSTVSAPANAIPGQAITITDIVQNDGQSGVTGVNISDLVPAGLIAATAIYTATDNGMGAIGYTTKGTGSINDIVSLPPGASITYTTNGEVNPSASGALLETAAVTTPSGVTNSEANFSGSTTTNQSTATVLLTPQADVSVTMSGSDPLVIGGTDVYTTVVTNHGFSDITGIAGVSGLTVADPFTFLTRAIVASTVLFGTAAGNSTGTLPAGGLNDILTMSAGAIVEYTITGTVTANAPSTLSSTVTATVPAGTTDPVLTNNASSVSAAVVAGGGTVLARSVFYGDSAFDGNNPSVATAPTTADFAAIATDKVALLPGQTATFDDYTGSVRGINGIFVDLTGDVPANITASDFAFTVGDTTPAGAGWTTAVAPTVTIFANQGIAGSDRIAFTWPSGTIAGKWLQVTVNADAKTRLSVPDVFYFGNAPGDSGNSTTDAHVNATDEVEARLDPHSDFSKPAPIADPNDFNRDARTNATDEVLARTNNTNFKTALILLSVPNSPNTGAIPAPALFSLAAPATSTRNSTALPAAAPASALVVASQPPPTSKQKVPARVIARSAKQARHSVLPSVQRAAELYGRLKVIVERFLD